MSQDRKQRLQSFVTRTSHNIIGDEKGHAQIFIDHLFRAFVQSGSLDIGGHPESRIKPGKEDAGGSGGTSFADYVWKATTRPGVLVEMKKRGEDLTRHRQQVFNHSTELAPSPKLSRAENIGTLLYNRDKMWHPTARELPIVMGGVHN